MNVFRGRFPVYYLAMLSSWASVNVFQPRKLLTWSVAELDALMFGYVNVQLRYTMAPHLAEATGPGIIIGRQDWAKVRRSTDGAEVRS